MYGRGFSTRQISDTIEELYGFEVSDGFVSDVTDKILEWQARPLEEVYPVVFIDATHYSVPIMEIGENDSAKYWLPGQNSSVALFITSEIL